MQCSITTKLPRVGLIQKYGVSGPAGTVVAARLTEPNSNSDTNESSLGPFCTAPPDDAENFSLDRTTDWHCGP